MRWHEAMKKAGARCDECVLRRQSPVPAERHRHDEFAVVAVAPGLDEVEEGRPLCGPQGRELESAMTRIGVTRNRTFLTHAVACRFPEDDPDATLSKIKRRNKQAKLSPGMEGYQITPFEACSKRLWNELEPFAGRIALGGHAAQALIPGRDTAKIMDVRGHKFPLVHRGRELKVFPTVAPGYVQKARRYTHVFQRDVSNAVAWFRGNDTWVQPRFVNAQLADDGSILRNADGEPQFDIPSLATIADYLSGAHEAWQATGGRPRWILYDTETDGIYTDRARLRCIGIGGPNHVLVVPILSVDGVRRFYSVDDEDAIQVLFAELFEDETILKVGHNAGSFDRDMMEHWCHATPSPLMDTVLVHKGVDAELPHTLDFVGSYYTSVHAWKLDKENGWNARTDGDLWLYNGLDVVVNARCVEPLVKDAYAKKQIIGRIPPVSELSANVSRDPVTRDHAMQALGVGLKRVGIPVKQRLRAAKEVEAVAEMDRWRKSCHSLLTALDVRADVLIEAGVRNADTENVDEDDDDARDDFEAFDDAADAAGLSLGDFNPGSHAQVRKLIEQVFNLPEPVGLSKTAMRTGARGDGDLRTGKAVLQSYMTDRRITEQQRAFFHSVFMYRKWAKAYGSEARPNRLDYEAIRAKRLGRLYKGPKLHRCNLWEDGRLHANWNAHGTLVGRFATSAPNVNNASPWFKDALGFEYDRPLADLDDDDMVLVGADVEGIHLRIIAILWDVPTLVEAFEKGYDVHSLRAEKVLGERYRKADGYLGYGVKPKKKKSMAAKYRDMIKTMTYAGAYGGEPMTIYRVMRSAVDEKGRLQMPDLKPEEVEVLHDKWMTSEPEWQRAWAKNLRNWKRDGYIATPILGRRRYFLDGNENDVKNYEILATEGDIMGEVTQRFVDAVPFEFEGPGTGLILQNHDALYCQTPKRRATEVREIMRDLMNAKYGPIQLRAGAVDIGLHMGEVAV